MGAPAVATARTPCAGEQATPNAVNATQVSDAVACLTNQIRAHHGLPALRRDGRLNAASRLHSFDMAARDFFDHTNPDGQDPSDRAAAQGYPGGVGENIAAGYANARSVVVGWMASGGHCANILSGAVDLGVGTAASPTPHYTQAFGDYFSRPVDERPRNGCPYAVDLDALSAPAATQAAPVAAPPATGARAGAPVPSSPVSRASTPARPAVRALSLSRKRFRTRGRVRGRGTTISYRLSRRATVTFRVQRVRTVRRSGRRRTVYTTLKSRFTDRGSAGRNRHRFKGRLAGRTLPPGRYRLRAVARGGDGRRSKLRHVRFSVRR